MLQYLKKEHWSSVALHPDIETSEWVMVHNFYYDQLRVSGLDFWTEIK